MKFLNFPDDLTAREGIWNTAADIRISDVAVRDIYRAPVEPSYVCWAILWKERSGLLKLSFTEATGDKTAWPPTYNFNSRDIEYYLKTLVSRDGGGTWTDTGWREDLDKLWIINPDHHIRHVFEMPDGTLMRNYCHTVEGRTSECRLTTYDESKENAGDFFPFRSAEKITAHQKFSSIWTSDSGGESWKEIHLFVDEPPLFLSAIHPLRDGVIVAMGAFRPSETDYSTWGGALVESADGGKTWSKPVVIARNDDRLNPQGIGEECDFVELDDERLLVNWRCDGAGTCHRQQYLQRDRSSRWQADPARINPLFPSSGYPYMNRAADGTVFYYCHASIKYSCDDGITWDEIPLGFSYYGQMTEVAPGRILAVTQMNIGDCSYPWKHDVSMRQTTFNYERVGVVEGRDEEKIGALAALDVGEPTDFHVAFDMRLDAASGIAYQVASDTCRFVALTLPGNASRLPGGRANTPQNAFLQIGKIEGGRTTVLRKIAVGKVMPGAWVELQVSRKGDFLTAACNISAEQDWAQAWPEGPVEGDVTYTCFRDESPAAGGLALFANKSTAAFRNVRFSAIPEPIRDNWIHRVDRAARITLDAGRGD